MCGRFDLLNINVNVNKCICNLVSVYMNVLDWIKHLAEALNYYCLTGTDDGSFKCPRRIRDDTI